MRLLLDTHIAVWSVIDTRRLSRRARSTLEEFEGSLFVSAVSIWEIAIKHRLARITDPMPLPGTAALAEFEQAGFRMLDVKPAHATAVDTLVPITTDPFDRLLIAQVKSEPMHFLTADARLAAYGELVIAV